MNCLTHPVLSAKRDQEYATAARDPEAWRAFDQASRDLDHRKDELLDEIVGRLTQSARIELLFTLRWRLE